ncbi:MAG TPA: transketolase C-terminal domain-containing protein [Desulfobacterales bacterium]|nr:transketolase C-terminal domain-containing protein [Desulfobacterales bacterium]
MEIFRDPRKTFGEALVAAGETNKNIVALSADSSSGSGMTPFQKRFPERHIEFGIMEQGIMGFAAGLATTGKIPFVVAIAPFVTARPFEMFRNDLGYMRQNVKVVGRCAGLTYSDLGATHQSLDDVAIIRTIPGVTILNPGDPVDIIKAVHAAVEHVGPVYIKVGSPPMPVLMDEGYPFRIGKGVVMENGSDVTLIGTGTVLSKAAGAAKILKDKGIHARLINLHTIKPLDTELILKAARETGKIVTVEEGYVAGGMGSCIAEFLSAEFPVPIKMIGVIDQFAEPGPYEDVLALYGLQSGQIAETVEHFLKTVDRYRY